MDRELPERARAWLTTVLPGTRLVRARWLTGGIDHANHAVTVADRSGREREYVLRRWVRANWREIDPDYTVEREHRALDLLERGGAHTPRVVATDPEGDRAGQPALLMTKLPGGPPPEHLSEVDELGGAALFVDQLAAVAEEIHAVDATGAGIPAYEAYHDLAYRTVPGDAQDPPLWSRAMHYLAGTSEPRGTTFLHRDYHPYNVLWSGFRVSAVIDWSNASIGHPDMDTAHMRVNLALSYGLDVAEQFRLTTEARTGRRYDRFWDARVVIDFICGLTEGQTIGSDLPELGRTTAHGDPRRRVSVLETLLREALA